MKYAVLALLVALFLSVLVARGAYRRLDDAKADVARLEAQNALQQQAMARLEASIRITDAVMQAWEQDKQQVQAGRDAARHTVKRVAQHENNHVWSDSSVPADMWRLLGGQDAGAACSADAAGSAAGRLPQNPSTDGGH